MIEDILEPVELYRSTFQAEHARNTAEFFEDLVRRSGVDEGANAKTVAELRRLEQQIAALGSTAGGWRLLRGLVVLAGVVCVITAFVQDQYLWLLGAGAAALLVMARLNPLIGDLNQRLTRLEKQKAATLAVAWEQMAPLNALYTWDIVARLVQKTVPRIALDPYFANARLDELRESFGWNDDFNDGRSVQFAHSGVLNGNPFVLAQTLDHWMGTRTYHGSLTITWSEKVRDSNGNWVTRNRSQTLHASIAKPFPEYGSRTVVIYGSEAAPDLSFSRRPSDLSGLDNGMIGRWRKGRAVKQLEKKSRQLESGSGFTVMANREFDALFGATDRDHEVQFRLLFTPLAQQEMLKLLKDKEVGFGDNFQFAKERMVNLVEPAHLRAVDITADPAKFRGYELAHARKFFNDYHNDFFKSFFFGLAPLLTIPIYQQHRSHADIYRDVYSRRSCFWEHESIANYIGEAEFRHPECVTRSILKTSSVAEPDGSQRVHVAAHGYGGIDRVDYISVLGGDGRYHNVPVEWVEYYGVRRDSNMVVHESDDRPTDTLDESTSTWQTTFQQRGIDPRRAVVRRSIASVLLGGGGAA